MEEGTWRDDGSSSNSDDKKSNSNHAPFPLPLPDAIRFGKAVSVPHRHPAAAAAVTQYVVVVGESCSRQGCTTIQCLDVATATWLWQKSCTQLITVDALSVVHNHLFAVGTVARKELLVDQQGHSFYDNSNNNSEYGAFTCNLVTLMDDTPSTTAIASAALVLRNVCDIQLQGGLSRYSGQMKQVGDAWIPHGEGLEVWADEKKVFGPLHEMNNSYYRGTYCDGYRDGMGEMYLKAEDQLYTGQFEKGSWGGLGRLQIKKRVLNILETSSLESARVPVAATFERLRRRYRKTPAK